MSDVGVPKTPAHLANTVRDFWEVFNSIRKIKGRQEILLLKGMLIIHLIIPPLYFNEVCFTTSGICSVARCKSPSTST